MRLSDIHTINWQLGLAYPSSIVQGMDDVKQCMDVILKTRKGEDPLRPHFGCDLFDWIDKPLPVSVPNMKMVMIDAISRYEPRVIVERITHDVVKGGVKFNILYRFPDGTEDIFELSTADLAGQVQQGAVSVTLQAVYADGFRYHIHLVLDNNAVLPVSPFAGFSSISNLFAWVVDNWSIYGTWRLLESQQRVILNVAPGAATSGVLTIEATENVLSALIPGRADDDDMYDIIFINPENTRVQPLNPEGYITEGQILGFVKSNYAGYGNWTIENGYLILDGSIDLGGYQLIVNTFKSTHAFDFGFDLGFDS